MTSGNIFLVGMMGSGKTTVGKILARRLGLRFVDTDREIEVRTGVPIITIFELEGEAGFRRRESALIAELALRSHTVISTGGGAAISPENRDQMRNSGLVVYLQASIDRLFERVQRDVTRPLLSKGDKRATLAALLETRDPLYRAASHLVIESSHSGSGKLADRIIEAIQRLETDRSLAQSCPIK